MTELAKLFEPSKDRLINNAFQMMTSAREKKKKKYWESVYLHLIKQYDKLQ